MYKRWTGLDWTGLEYWTSYFKHTRIERVVCGAHWKTRHRVMPTLMALCKFVASFSVLTHFQTGCTRMRYERDWSANGQEMSARTENEATNLQRVIRVMASLPVCSTDHSLNMRVLKLASPVQSSPVQHLYTPGYMHLKYEYL